MTVEFPRRCWAAALGAAVLGSLLAIGGGGGQKHIGGPDGAISGFVGYPQGLLHIGSLFFGIMKQPVRRHDKGNRSSREHNRGDGQNDRRDGEPLGEPLNRPKLRLKTFRYANVLMLLALIGTVVVFLGWILFVLGYGRLGILSLLCGGYLAVGGPLSFSFPWMPFAGAWRTILRTVVQDVPPRYPPV